MTQKGFETILRALNDAGVRYLVAGGIAVIAHGYLRATSDIDLVLALTDENLVKAVNLFEGMGYRPRIPVALKDLADASKRRQWIEEKHAVVFSLYGPHPLDWHVDIFLQAPFDFETEWNRAERIELKSHLIVPVVALETLISMKIAAGRHKDQDDVLQLQRIWRGGIEHA